MCCPLSMCACVTTWAPLYGLKPNDFQGARSPANMGERRDPLKLFLGGLTPTATEDQVQAMFRNHDITPLDVMVLPMKAGASMNHAFVSFWTEDDAREGIAIVREYPDWSIAATPRACISAHRGGGITWESYFSLLQNMFLLLAKSFWIF